MRKKPKLPKTVMSIDYESDDVTRMAKAICSAFPKVPDGCAALCMDRLGEIPHNGCRHAVAVHGKSARRILEGGWRK
jgi:hypothetical protein